MRTRRQKECCAAAVMLLVSVAFTAAMVVRAGEREGVQLLCYAVVCLSFSWAMAAAARAGEESAAENPAVAPSGPAEVVVRDRRPQPAAKQILSPVLNAFSIDLEDYFHTEVAAQAVRFEHWDELPARIESTMPRLLDLLDETSTRATIFVLGWIAEKYPHLIREAATRGHEIACHSYRHRAVFRLDRETFYQDTWLAQRLIEDATGVQVVGYRAPCFSITQGSEWAFDVLSELGFRYDSSVHPVRHSFYGNARAAREPHLVGSHGLLEIPVAVWKKAGFHLPIGGGAYLRLLPLRYSLMGLKALNIQERRPGTIYMHPWEIDPAQPDLDLDRASTIRQTWGTARMESRVRQMLQSFRFAPMAEVYGALLSGAQSVDAEKDLGSGGGLLTFSHQGIRPSTANSPQ